LAQTKTQDTPLCHSQQVACNAGLVLFLMFLTQFNDVAQYV